MGELRLEVRDFAGPDRWRWVLTDRRGAFVADHEVRLDGGCWEFEAFTDLLGYLDWHVMPDRQVRDEARIVGELGAWVGSQVFGPVAGALVRARPATVRVVVPPEARVLRFRPLELAHVGGRPISVQDVTLVMESAPMPASASASASGPEQARATRAGGSGSGCGCSGCSASPRAASR